MDVQLTEEPAEGLLLRGREVLVAEEDHAVVDQGRMDLLEGRLVQGSGEIDATDLGAGLRGELLHMDRGVDHPQSSWVEGGFNRRPRVRRRDGRTFSSTATLRTPASRAATAAARPALRAPTTITSRPARAYHLAPPSRRPDISPPLPTPNTRRTGSRPVEGAMLSWRQSLSDAVPSLPPRESSPR